MGGPETRGLAQLGLDPDNSAVVDVGSGGSGSASSERMGVEDFQKLRTIGERLKLHLLTATDDSKWDREVVRRCWAMAIVAMIGVGLMVVELQVVFDDSAGYCDDLTETMVVNLTNRNAVTFDLAPPPCVKLIELEPTLTTELLKVAITIDTIVLLILIASYYRLLNVLHHRKWQIIQVQNVCFNRSLRTRLIVELLLNAYHPLPGLGYATDGLVNDKIGVFMFIRVYHFIRVMRNMTRVYKHRAAVKADSRNPATKNMKYGSWLALKSLFYDHTLSFVLVASVLGFAILCWFIFITEREQQESLNSWNVLYFTLITMTTVGYGDFAPKSDWGRLVCALASVVGILLSSLMVAVINQALTLKEHQRFATEWSKISTVKDAEREVAARFIQNQWKTRNKDDLSEDELTRREEELVQLTQELRLYRKKTQRARDNLYDSTVPQLLALESHVSLLNRKQTLLAEKLDIQQTSMSQLEKKMDLILLYLKKNSK